MVSLVWTLLQIRKNFLEAARTEDNTLPDPLLDPLLRGTILGLDLAILQLRPEHRNYSEFHGGCENNCDHWTQWGCTHCQESTQSCDCHIATHTKGIPVTFVDDTGTGAVSLFHVHRPALVFTGSYWDVAENRKVVLPVLDNVTKDVVERGIYEYTEQFEVEPIGLLLRRSNGLYSLALQGGKESDTRAGVQRSARDIQQGLDNLLDYIADVQDLPPEEIREILVKEGIEPEGLTQRILDRVKERTAK